MSPLVGAVFMCRLNGKKLNLIGDHLVCVPAMGMLIAIGDVIDDESYCLHGWSPLV